MTEAVRQKKLTKDEARRLGQLRRDGLHLVGPQYQPSKALQSLVAKGYVRELPGLFDETPQGYVPAD